MDGWMDREGLYQISIKLCLGPGIIPIRLLLG